MAHKEFIGKVQHRGKDRKTIELTKEVRDEFKIGEHVHVSLRKVK